MEEDFSSVQVVPGLLETTDRARLLSPGQALQNTYTYEANIVSSVDRTAEMIKQVIRLILIQIEVMCHAI